MILSDILRSDAADEHGRVVGRVVDVRFDHVGGEHGEPSTARLHGLIVSPHGASSFLGYGRSDVNSPWLIAHFFAWRERGAFLVRWNDVRRIETGLVRLRPGYTAYDPSIPPPSGGEGDDR